MAVYAPCFLAMPGATCLTQRRTQIVHCNDIHASHKMRLPRRYEPMGQAWQDASLAQAGASGSMLSSSMACTAAKYPLWRCAAADEAGPISASSAIAPGCSYMLVVVLVLATAAVKV